MNDLAQYVGQSQEKDHVCTTDPFLGGLKRKQRNSPNNQNFGWYTWPSTLHGKTSLFRGLQRELLLDWGRGSLRKSYMDGPKEMGKSVKSFVLHVSTNHKAYTTEEVLNKLTEWLPQLASNSLYPQRWNNEHMNVIATGAGMVAIQGAHSTVPIYQDWASCYCCQMSNLLGTETNAEPVIWNHP